MTLKMAVLAPTPRAVARTAAEINPGLRRKVAESKTKIGQHLSPFWHAGDRGGEGVARVCSRPEQRFAERRVPRPGRDRLRFLIDYDFLRSAGHIAFRERMLVLLIAGAQVVEVRIGLHRVRRANFGVAGGARLQIFLLLILRLSVKLPWCRRGILRSRWRRGSPVSRYALRSPSGAKNRTPIS